MDNHERGENLGGRRNEIGRKRDGEYREVVTQADEGELLLVTRVLFGFQSIVEEPKEDPFHTQEEKTIIPTHLVPFKLP